MLDLLERYPNITIPVGTFVRMLPPLRIRTYSISSSPLSKPDHAMLTWAVVDSQPAAAAAAAVGANSSSNSNSSSSKRFLGVASNYLSDLVPGSVLHASVRSPTTLFRLPQDRQNTPVIMVAGGTGIAPFRGFCEERATQIAAGDQRLAPALLIFGCHAPDVDDLYRDELNAWEAAGVVEVYRAYSRAPGQKRKYVQDSLREQRERVAALWVRGARCYVCGSSRMAAGVKEVVAEIAYEVSKGMTASMAKCGTPVEWLDSLGQERYVTEVFA